MTGTEVPKVVLVTGASGGVGRGIAIACGRAGWTVWIAARREAQAAEVAAEVDAVGGVGRSVACDVADPVSVRSVVAAVRAVDLRLDGVVHNATSGLSPRPDDLGTVAARDVADHVGVSLRGTYLLAVEAHPHLVAAKGSYVVLTSEAGFEGKARLPVYAAVKGAQRGVVRALAREWGPDGVRVNCLAPLAATPAMEQAFANDPAMADRVLGRNPLGVLGDAVDDIGPVARFLLSDDSRYVTGMTVMADGASCPIT
jgi:NAD(P)-dependent dehydrogenase (short-subunit alcohol dehydrogenase family)